MGDPVTVGALAASTLAIASQAFLKGMLGESAKDAYQALKNKIAAWSSNDIDALEKTPDSGPRQAVLAEIVDSQPEGDKAAIRGLALALVAALKQASPVGLDAERLKAVEVQLGSINVTEGTGVRLGEALVETLRTGDIRVGAPPLPKE